MKLRTCFDILTRHMPVQTVRHNHVRWPLCNIYE